MSISPPAAPRRSPFEQVLVLFADVRAGEGAVAALMLLNVFLILCSYYVLKTVREGLILTGGMLGLSGEELKAYATAAMALLLVVFVPLYGKLASRVRRIPLINVSYGAVLGCLVLFFVLGRAGVPVGLAFFLWLGVINIFLVGQFWSYANDVYTEEQGKRLFPMIAIGASAGAILGPEIARMGETFALMIVAAVIFAACLVLFNAVERLGGGAGKGAATRPPDAPLGRDGAFQLVLRHRYITLIAVMLIVANLVNTIGEFVLSSAATAHASALVPDSAHAELLDGAARTAAITAERRELVKDFYGSFYRYVNIAGLVIQAFVVSRLFKFIGVAGALFVLPLIALGGYGLIGVVGGVALLRIAKIAENSTDYSLMNTVRHALWLPTSREAKYKAKSAVDTFFVRIGDALAALVVWVGLHQLGLTGRGFALVNIAIIALWLVIVSALARRYRALTTEPAPAPSR